MRTFQNTVSPEYLKRFKCIAAACDDCCCIGWDIVIDQITYEFYQQCRDRLLKPLFRDHIVINTEKIGNTDDTPYARIKMDNYSCPLLADDKLCMVQKTLGEDALSITCATYPRVFNAVDGVLERSLCVSCPEAARLVLLDEKPMQFDYSEKAAAVRNDRLAILQTDSLEAVDKPYRYFHLIRTFIIDLLQDRTHLLWQRLVILGIFCDRLEQIAAEYYDEDIPYLIKHFAQRIQDSAFRQQLTQVDAPSSQQLQLQVAKILIDHRLQGAFVSERFLDCVNKFIVGLDYTEGASIEAVSVRYAEAYAAYYQPFMKNHEYILENYLVNYVFKNLFPFGAQQGGHIEEGSLYEEYMLLIIQYSLMKALLIGIAGYYRDDFTTKHVLDLIQIFTKGIEHNRPYLKQAVQFIKLNDMGNTGGMATLIKN